MRWGFPRLMAFGVIAAIAAVTAGCGGEETPKATITEIPASPTAEPTRVDLPVGERMIDVGGHALAIRCAGQGAPTVIFEQGAFPFVDEFATTFMDVVANEWRVCSYDRAGVGKSEAGPNPRDGERIAAELHQLLTNAGEVEPFVMMSWSIAALYTPLFATAYPDDVAGVVFIDPRTATYQLAAGSDPQLTTLAAESPPAYGEELWTWDASAEQAEGVTWPDVPMVVLTAASADQLAFFATQRVGYDLWRDSHAALAARVTDGEHIILDDADHAIWGRRPDAVLDAIRGVVEASADAAK